MIALDAAAIAAALDEDGYAVVPGWFDAARCERVRAQYGEEAPYRKTVVMERHGFGRGEYKYFGYPLPADVDAARSTLYEALVPAANAWIERGGRATRFPATLPLMLALSAQAGQARAAALVLRYRRGDYNALHQDVYGEVAFPFQGTVLLSQPGAEFSGGEFVLVENRARMQSVAHVIPLGRGDLVIFPNRERIRRAGPKSTLRHGVAAVRGGERFTLGLILHDA